eukprot:238104_1
MSIFVLSTIFSWKWLSAQTIEDSTLTFYHDYDYYDETIYCSNNIDCVINCYNIMACAGITIIGPRNATLTVNCKAEELATGPDYSEYGGMPAYACHNNLNIHANHSTELHIFVYYEIFGLSSTTIFTPHNNNINTHILCGISGKYNSASHANVYAVCTEQIYIYSKFGFNTIVWTYYGNNMDSLTKKYTYHYPNIMYCGDHYQYSCTEFQVINRKYNCLDQLSPCYTSATNMTYNPSPEPTPSPSNTPTDITLSPTTLSPTTLSPTTLSPTTLSPTTLSPTTLSPTTLSPTTLSPTTLSPTTLSPTTLLVPISTANRDYTLLHVIVIPICIGIFCIVIVCLIAIKRSPKLKRESVTKMELVEQLQENIVACANEDIDGNINSIATNEQGENEGNDQHKWIREWFAN